MKAAAYVQSRREKKSLRFSGHMVSTLSKESPWRPVQAVTSNLVFTRSSAADVWNLEVWSEHQVGSDSLHRPPKTLFAQSRYHVTGKAQTLFLPQRLHVSRRLHPQRVSAGST